MSHIHTENLPLSREDYEARLLLLRTYIIYAFSGSATLSGRTPPPFARSKKIGFGFALFRSKGLDICEERTKILRNWALNLGEERRANESFAKLFAEQ